MLMFLVYSKVIQFYIYIYLFFFIIGYYKILNILPCAVQEDFVVYLFYV